MFNEDSFIIFKLHLMLLFSESTVSGLKKILRYRELKL
jgi:hypothetical protein